MAARPVLAALAAGAFFLGTAAASAQPLPRSSTDRPDDSPGPQIHFVYAVPSDQQDRGFDTDGTIDGSIAGIQSWLRGQTGGPGLRVDTSGGEPDVTFVRLPRTDAEYGSTGNPLDGILPDLQAAGVLQPRKLTAIYYEGSAPSPQDGLFLCGLGGASGASAVAMVILHDDCGYDLAGSKAGVTGNLEFVVLHEILHGMGFVPDCAPHSTHDGHVSDDPNDLMSPFLPQGTIVIDAAHDDYFRANIAGCLDLTQSRFLEGAGTTLTVAVVSNGGTGVVHSVPSGPSTVPFDCPPLCSDTYDAVQAVPVVLTAAPAPGSVFLGWEGICSGTNQVCTLQLASSGAATALFGKAPVRLTVAVSGAGSVASTPSGIACPARCAATFPWGAAVRLKVTLRPGWKFAGWSGACHGRVPCTVHLSQPAAVRATFRKG